MRPTLKFAEACHRLGFSVRTGRRLLKAGTFPVPEQPRVGRHHLFAARHVDDYVATAALREVKDVQPRRHRERVS